MSKFDLSKYTKAKIQKPSELTKPQMLAFYGKSGSGKTWLAASEASYYEEQKSDKKVLLIDTEGSATGTTVGLPDAYLEILPVVDPLELRQLIHGLITTEHDYGTVIIDTWDVYHDEYIEQLKKVTKNDQGKLDTRSAWGQLKVEQIKMINRLKKAPFRVFLVIHEETTKLSTGEMYKGFAISGSTANVLPGKPDAIGYTRRVVEGEGKNAKEVTIVDFRPSDYLDTKNRFNLGILKDTSMSQIYSIIEKKQQKEIQ